MDTPSTEMAEPYHDVSCSISFAEATETVTTTTTTSTRTTIVKNTPPITLKTPDIRQRDPQFYPLANTPTPVALRRFDFQINGKMFQFEEEQDPGADCRQSSTEHVIVAGPPKHPTPVPTVELVDTQQRISPSRKTGKRKSANPGSPVPQLRSNKRVRSAISDEKSLREDAIATPEEKEASDGRKLSVSKRLKTNPGQARLASEEHNEPLDGQHLSDIYAGPPSPPSFTSGIGMATTPPAADGEAQVADPFSDFSTVERTRLPPLVTRSLPETQVLPSPCLSPVTIAATPIPFPIQDDSGLRDDNPSIPQCSFGSSKELMGNIDSCSPSMLGVSSLGMTEFIERFDSYPEKIQEYVLHQLFRRCTKKTLQFVSRTVEHTLKRDFLTELPDELAVHIIRFLDIKTLCRASQVSRRWRSIIDQDDKTWSTRFRENEFEMVPGELEKAEREGWKWQVENYEKDMSAVLEEVASNTQSGSTRGAGKRKVAAKGYSSKRRRPRQSRVALPTPLSSSARSAAADEHTKHDQVLLADVPDFGLRNIRIPHLYKSIYRRHHSIRENWTKSEPHHIAFRAHGRHVVTCLQFDSEKIITGSDDTKIHVYNAETGALQKELNSHEGGVWALQYDGDTLVSGSTDRSVRVWDLPTGRCVHIFQGHTSTVRCLIILKPTCVGKRPDGSAILMPKEPLIITGSRDSTLRIWKMPKPGDRPVQEFVTDGELPFNPHFMRVLTGHTSSVRAIAARGDCLVSGSYDSIVRVWKISTGETVHRLVGHNQKVYSVILDHDRNRCISGSMDNSVRVWSLDNGSCVLTLEGHTSLVGLLDLNHDRLVSAAADTTLRIWDPETGQCKSTLAAHTGAITCFQHDDRKVISGSDRTLKMWNVKTGEHMKNVLTGLSGVWQVKFDERKCVAAVQRNGWTYIEVLDYGASRDGRSDWADRLGRRHLVDRDGTVIDSDDEHDLDEADDEEL